MTTQVCIKSGFPSPHVLCGHAKTTHSPNGDRYCSLLSGACVYQRAEKPADREKPDELNTNAKWSSTMKFEDMKVGSRYVVTKSSTDTTFEAGDHIRLQENGDILCAEAEGWIDACDVAEATKGMEVELDAEWFARKERQLLAQLAEIRAAKNR